MNLKNLLTSLLIMAIVAVAGFFYLDGKKEDEKVLVVEESAVQNEEKAEEEEVLVPISIPEAKKVESPKPTEFNCTGEKAADFACYRAYYSGLVDNGGLAQAFTDLKARYKENNYVVSQCHQIVHVIGFEASKKFTDVGEAFKRGDNFCSSGYYHGTLEGVVSKIGYNNVISKLNGICASIAEENRYSLMHHNCTHGLGHGLMAINDSEVFDSLILCDALTDSWEQSSCHGGVFMENIIFDEKYHKSKFLKPEDPLYPCNAVEDRYKDPCYLIQTAYMLKVTNGNWQEVFELCSSVGSYSPTCYQSLGRDASGWHYADIEKIKSICMLGVSSEQQSNCIVGAVKDVVWYRYSDVEGKALCASLDSSIQPICYSTVESYFTSL
jgi:hypothetical protein